jgi:Cys-tRNA(Pro)/Cys-tRNA(Cys) deacylase
MKRNKTSIGTPATVALDRAVVPYTVHTYAHDRQASW